MFFAYKKAKTIGKTIMGGAFVKRSLIDRPPARTSAIPTAWTISSWVERSAADGGRGAPWVNDAETGCGSPQVVQRICGGILILWINVICESSVVSCS